MKICPSCNNREDDSAIYCSYCGSPLPGSPVYDPETSGKDGDHLDEKLNSDDEGSPEAGKAAFGASLSWENQGDPEEADLPYNTNPDDPDRPGKPVWPVIAGILVFLIIVCAAAYFIIVHQKKVALQKKQINEEYSAIESIYQRQKDDYLEDVKKDWQGQEFYDKAGEAVDDKNSGNDQKISSLKEIRKDFEDYDEGLVKEQEKELASAYDPVQGQYKKEYLISGEAEKIASLEETYGTSIEEKKFKDALNAVEEYKALEDKIMNDSESSAMYSAKSILAKDEFIPETLNFSVNRNDYTDNGSTMGADHFCLTEKVADEEVNYLEVRVEDMEVDGNDAKYQLSFQSAQPDDYKSDREYTLHVRNQEGTRGFTAKQTGNPQKAIRKAAVSYMEEFVKAFNSDCNKEARTFSKLRDYLEAGSQAYEDYKNSLDSSSVQTQAIESSDDSSVSLSKDGQSVVFSTRFSYYVVRTRSYESIKDTTAENKYLYSGQKRNFEIYHYDREYILYSTDKWVNSQAQELSDSSSFKVYEHMTEKESFKIRIKDNKTLGPVYEHDNENPTIKSLEGMEYQGDSDKKMYSLQDIEGDEDEGDDDGGYENSEEEYADLDGSDDDDDSLENDGSYEDSDTD